MGDDEYLNMEKRFEYSMKASGVIGYKNKLLPALQFVTVSLSITIA